MVLLSARLLAPVTAFLFLSVVAIGFRLSTWRSQLPDVRAFDSAVQNISLDYSTPTQDFGSTYTDLSRNSSIGKCTAVYGYGHEYNEALETHFRHNQLHHYPLHVLAKPILDGLWSKEAALLGILLQELSRDETVRLRWLTWFDADAIIVHPLIPLETFLPPKDISNISAWSVEMLLAVIAYRTFRPQEPLPFTEQSAMAAILRNPKFQRHVAVVPFAWLNSYPSDWSPDGVSHQVKHGDMVLHFAGVNQKVSAIRDWLLTLAQERTLWERPLADTTLTAQAQKFWETCKDRPGESLE